MAGLFDGEGCIHLSPRNGYALTVSIGQKTHTGLCQAIAHEYQGRLHPQKGGMSTWHANGVFGVAFLEAVLPHLIVKRGQAALAIEHGRLPWRRHQNGGAKVVRTPDQIAVDRDYARRIKDLKL